MKKGGNIDMILDELKKEKLRKHFEDKGLLIVGLNDSQGVNTTSTFFKKGLLEYLAKALENEKLKPLVINAFSLTMNKTEHIDYFLNNNLTLEEIKLSQIYSVVSALEKVMTDINLPKFLGSVGNAYRLIYTPKKGDEKIKISTSLRNAQEPVLIYSSGVNNLMREVGANPFGIKKDYLQRDKKPNYYYTLEKTKDPKTLKKVIYSISKNFITIYETNFNTDIYALGAYIPKSLQSEEMNIFRDLVMAYNYELINLCKQYGVTFVNTEEVGKKYNNSELNFHISTAGHNSLANHILGLMYQNKIENNKKIANDNMECKFSNDGSMGVLQNLMTDYEKSFFEAMIQSGYASKRQLQIANEHQREIEVFNKVLSRRKK